MEKLFEYIFYKACKFDELIYKDGNQWSQYYGAIIVSMIMIHTLYLFLDICFYFLKPTILESIDESYKFVATAILIGMVAYVNYKKRYLYINENCNNLSKMKKRKYGILSILYILIIIGGYIWISGLIRNYNLEGKYINIW